MFAAVRQQRDRHGARPTLRKRLEICVKGGTLDGRCDPSRRHFERDMGHRSAHWPDNVPQQAQFSSRATRTHNAQEELDFTSRDPRPDRRQRSRSSSSESTIRSAAETSVSANWGTAMQVSPAALAAATPDAESSNATASAGSTPRREQASR